jgi:mRNA-degrading endonuclease RelE of RelBE toxin-antitoxin system
VPSDARYLGRDDDGDKVFRIRVGDHRVLYVPAAYCVLVVRIDKRSRVYD